QHRQEVEQRTKNAVQVVAEGSQARLLDEEDGQARLRPVEGEALEQLEAVGDPKRPRKTAAQHVPAKLHGQDALRGSGEEARSGRPARRARKLPAASAPAPAAPAQGGGSTSTPRAARARASNPPL